MLSPPRYEMRREGEGTYRAVCPCNPDGAFQMRIMLQPDYREKLLACIFAPGVPAPPDVGFGEPDGMMNGEPALLGVDMNLRRISGVIQAAREQGKSAHIFIRPCQRTALRELYPDVCLYKIEDDEIMELFSFPAFLAEPDAENPYVTQNGGYVHSKAVSLCKEARRAG